MPEMPEWVEVNQLWIDEQSHKEHLAKGRELTQWAEARIAEKFGPEPKYDGDDLYVHSRLDEMIKRCPRLDERESFSQPSWLAEMIATGDPEIAYVARRRAYQAAAREWYATDVEYGHRVDEVDALLCIAKARQFKYNPVCEPGVVIEARMPNGEISRLMLGDIDPSSYDAGHYPLDGATVLRYLDLRPLYK